MRALAARFDRLPIRWRLAVTSAGLTFAILALFAFTFAAWTSNRLSSDFDEELQRTASDLARPGLPEEQGRDVIQLIAAGDASIRIVDTRGRVARQSLNAPALGAPRQGVRDVDGHRVAAVPIPSDSPFGPQLYVQYAKPKDDLNASIARVRLFLLLGVLGGTGLALLAGLAVARRAMAPIAGLTAAAREVARTRDPEVGLPRPQAEDEVADLARTLEGMLRALAQSRRETEAALERQREFVADASHELRTPLTSVLANLELLEEELKAAAADPEHTEIAGSALRSTRRMRRLVGDLLLLARADAGRGAARRPTVLADVAAAAAAEIAPVAAGHDLALDVEPDVAIDAVPDDLHRLVLNLVENAVRHTPPGTSVRVAGVRDGDTAVLTVEDDGPGIPPEQRERMFDRFARGAGDAGVGGSGLGLAIVRAVAEAHGGSVEAGDGDGGRGARLVVRLPAAQTSTTTGSTIGRRRSRS